MTRPLVDKADIARSFSLAAKTYDAAAFIQKEIGQRLLERLDLLKTFPETILDVGAGTGSLTRSLQQKFPRSRIWGIDLAQGMISYAKHHQPWHLWKNKPFYLCGDSENLPFAPKQFDLIFSNFTLQWCALDKTFSEFMRVLKPNGMIFFSTLGPQTLFELRQSFAKNSSFTHVNAFVDMHDIGDLLLNSHFGSPVIDMEMITIRYQRVEKLLQDLKATGAKNMNFSRLKGLFAKNYFMQMLQAYEVFKQPDNLYPATFEVIYGHAYRKEKQLYQQDEKGTVYIPADKLPILDY